MPAGRQQYGCDPPADNIEHVASKFFSQHDMKVKVQRFLIRAWTLSVTTLRKELPERRNVVNKRHEFLKVWMSDVVGRLCQAKASDLENYTTDFMPPELVADLFLTLDWKGCVPRDFRGDGGGHGGDGVPRKEFLATVQRSFRDLGIHYDVNPSDKADLSSPSTQAAASEGAPLHIIAPVLEEYFWDYDLQQKLRRFLVTSWQAVLKTARAQCEKKKRPNRPVEFLYAWADDVLGRLRQAAHQEAVPPVEEFLWVEYAVDLFISLADCGCIPSEFAGPAESKDVANAMYKVYRLLELGTGEGGYTGPAPETRQKWLARSRNRGGGWGSAGGGGGGGGWASAGGGGGGGWASAGGGGGWAAAPGRNGGGGGSAGSRGGWRAAPPSAAAPSSHSSRRRRSGSRHQGAPPSAAAPSHGSRRRKSGSRGGPRAAPPSAAAPSRSPLRRRSGSRGPRAAPPSASALSRSPPRRRSGSRGRQAGPPGAAAPGRSPPRRGSGGRASEDPKDPHGPGCRAAEPGGAALAAEPAHKERRRAAPAPSPPRKKRPPSAEPPLRLASRHHAAAEPPARKALRERSRSRSRAAAAAQPRRGAAAAELRSPQRRSASEGAPESGDGRPGGGQGVAPEREDGGGVSAAEEDEAAFVDVYQLLEEGSVDPGLAVPGLEEAPRAAPGDAPKAPEAPARFDMCFGGVQEDVLDLDDA